MSVEDELKKNGIEVLELERDIYFPETNDTFLKNNMLIVDFDIFLKVLQHEKIDYVFSCNGWNKPDAQGLMEEILFAFVRGFLIANVGYALVSEK